MTTAVVDTVPSARARPNGDRVAEPSLIVIFGASGDLAKRKLIPSLFNLFCERLLPPETTILGYARSEFSEEEFRQAVYVGICHHGAGDFSEDDWNAFAGRLFYQSGAYDDPQSFHSLRRRLIDLETDRATGRHRLFYLATPPAVFAAIAANLGAVDLAQPAPGAWTRLVVEKPFGHNLESAQQLNQQLLQIFNEHQLYRIDHYLGKETVQNILAFRFGNGIFEPIWNRNYVDNVQITVAESLGVEGRGGYYDRAGALRDIIQNHGLQLLTLTAMEPPVAFDATAVRDQKVNVLRSVRPLRVDEVSSYTARAQYTSGAVGGTYIPGYLAEKGVEPDSTTETYVAWKLEIDNWRWNGVPFYLRSGKAMPKKVTEVTISFRHAPHLLFQKADMEEQIISNVLTLRIQPDEGISLRFGAKIPGPAMHLEPVNMEFRYAESFGTNPAEAYERLLLDVVLGDSTLFTRRDEVEVAWDRVSRLQEGWRRMDEEARQTGGPRLSSYKAGTWGPAQADELLTRDGRHWRNP